MKALLLLLLLLLVSPLTFLAPKLDAQASASVHGAVTDESGAVIPGAKVTVSNATGQVKSGTAGDDGSYSINGLVPGTIHRSSHFAWTATDKAFRHRSVGIAKRHGQPTIAGGRRKAGSDGARKRRTRK